MGSTAALPCLMLLCLLHLVAGASAQPRYLVLFPYVIYYPHGGKVHIHLMDLDGPVRVTLHLASSHGVPNVTLEETGNKILQLDWPLFPNISTPTEEVAYLHVSIQGGSLRVSQQRMVLLKAPGLWTAIQTDKTTYEPGQTVKFRILHLEEDFIPSDRKLPLVTVTDFGGRTIASWQDVSLQQGIADLSLPLAHSSLDSYTIRVEQTTHIFYVERNRPPHFQVLLQLPSFVTVTDEMIPLHVCGWYPSGKPFRGRAEARLCQWHNYYLNEPGKCATFEAETGRNGCFSTQISTASFNLTSPDYERRLYANAILTERRTGNLHSLTKSCNILPEMPTAAFKNTDGFYKHGMPPTGTGDLKEVPLPSKNESRNDSTVLNSSSSDSQSFLKIHRMKRTPPCRKPLRLRVDYVLNKEALGTELQSVDVVFLVMARDTIVSLLRKELTLEAGLRGSFSLELPVGPRLVPTAMVLGYVMLPGGNVVGDWAELHIAMCFPNQVKLSFPEQKALAGSQVRLKVQAAPGSLCAIHIMDQPTSYYGLKAAYGSKVVYNLRPSSEDSSYSEYGAFCVDPYWGMHPVNAIPLNPYDMTSFEYKRRRARQAAEFLRFQDPCDPGVRAALRTVTNTVLNSSMAFQTVAGLEKDKEEDEREPRPRQDQALQKDFPGTWLWELVPVGEEGSAEVPVTVPNAITEWTAGMFCTAPTGLGLAPTVTLLTFKPFFVELALPYAVTRGKTFTLAATVFSYLRQSLRVRVTLAESAELEVSASADGAESSCISEFKARTFRWDVKATSLGKVNVTVTAQALHSEELCNTEVPVVPAQGHVDTVTKLLAVEVNAEALKHRRPM
ncbi:alpha-2-macroglobulin-like isoform X1 [Anas acuta]|uniref:alpha-2-macroglobulin-like isoform X1 n=1 Tax=Anas acuta TaxID=28680 RepID=UPI0035C8E2C6